MVGRARREGPERSGDRERGNRERGGIERCGGGAGKGGGEPPHRHGPSSPKTCARVLGNIIVINLMI